MNITPESQAINLLLDLLEQEQRCLVQADIQSMSGVIERKSKTLMEINQFAQQRYKTLANLGFSANENGMPDWLAKHAHKTVQAEWLATQQTLVKAKELNRVNGILINKHMQRTQQMLNIIQQKTDSDHLYGANGQATSQVRLRNAVLG